MVMQHGRWVEARAYHPRERVPVSQCSGMRCKSKSWLQWQRQGFAEAQCEAGLKGSRHFCENWC